MPATPALTRSATSWQLILADLALILFLITAAALSGGEQDTGAKEPPADGNAALLPGAVAPAQALYRAGPGLPTLAQWLEQQPRDPRATLTIIAQYTKAGKARDAGPSNGRDDRAISEAERAWADARSMAATAQALGVRTRVIIRSGAQYDVHASLAHDQPGD
ncbi:MAG: hypothetical protein AAFQ90_00715 [Pseudomonadota bacterium]